MFCTACKQYCFDSGQSDYTIETLQLTFSAGSDLRECTTVEAINDPVSENNEQLTLSFTSNVTQGTETSILNIIDNDSELFYV